VNKLKCHKENNKISLQILDYDSYVILSQVNEIIVSFFILDVLCETENTE
jgi:hypothetical protein